MRLCTYRDGGGSRLGSVEDGVVVPLAGRDVGDALAGLPEPAGAAVALEGLELLAPLAPGKLIGVGLNYRDHAAETGAELPREPLLFAKLPSSVTAPAGDVVRPAYTEELDYEGELAVVIGRPAARVSRDDADGYIAGYAVANDVSARDYQFRTKEMLQGKTFDRFCPLGPWLARPCPVTGLGELRLTTTVNGEVRQSATLREMAFDVPYLIEYLSAFMTLLPGDVLLTGTPAGIGAAMRPRRWLRDGDTVDIEIAGIGRITNRFTGPSHHSAGTGT
jgi:acylpyruvate hydrolase